MLSGAFGGTLGGALRIYVQRRPAIHIVLLAAICRGCRVSRRGSERRSDNIEHIFQKTFAQQAAIDQGGKAIQASVLEIGITAGAPYLIMTGPPIHTKNRYLTALLYLCRPIPP